MGKWRVSATAAASLLLASCFNASGDSAGPTERPEGLDVVAVESRTLDIPPGGSLEVDLLADGIALKSLQVNTIAAEGRFKIEVAALSGIPTELEAPPAEDVYQYVQIAHDNLEESAVANVALSFEVGRSWIDSNGYVVQDIALERYSGRWEALPTRAVGQGEGNVQYEAISPGLSLFAITADRQERSLSRLAVVRQTPTATPAAPVVTPSPTPTEPPFLVAAVADTPTPATPSPLPSPRPTATPTPAATPQDVGPAAVATPTASPTPAPTRTATPTPSPRPPDPSPTPTVPPTATASPTPVPSATATPTPVPSPTAAPTPNPRASATASPSPSPTPPATATPPPTATPAPTAIPTPVPTARPTFTPTPRPTSTRTPTPTFTATPTFTPTPTPTFTPRPTATPTPTATPLPASHPFGVVLHSGSMSHNRYFLDGIGANWYLDFNRDLSQVPSGTHKVPFIQVPTNFSLWNSGQPSAIESLSDDEIAQMGFPTRPQLREMAQSAPGSYWYIWGEPNRYGYITGARFAPVFRYIMTQLRAGDPTAKIISPSILNWDFTCVGCGAERACERDDEQGGPYPVEGYQCGRMWLEEFVTSYENAYLEKPPVDVWAIDVYPIDWDNTPNNNPEEHAKYAALGVDARHRHSFIATQQLVGMRQYLDSIGYESTPIWITEIAIHVAFEGWQFDPFPLLVPWNPEPGEEPTFHWDLMSDYLSSVLDWLEANAEASRIERWFFFITWADVYNGVEGGYLGPIFYDGPEQGASLTCLGELLRARSLDEPRVACDADGNTVAD